MNLAHFIEADLPKLIDDWADYALALSQEDSQLSGSQLALHRDPLRPLDYVRFDFSEF
ncbi:hypothetical protein [Caballeronia grimmiae]|uniref:hypothetical protein n=1 Tax=Caballeronia grimmiae TaxID=1071679 RepID=UPI0038B7A130